MPWNFFQKAHSAILGYCLCFLPLFCGWQGEWAVVTAEVFQVGACTLRVWECPARAGATDAALAWALASLSGD